MCQIRGHVDSYAIYGLWRLRAGNTTSWTWPSAPSLHDDGDEGVVVDNGSCLPDVYGGVTMLVMCLWVDLVQLWAESRSAVQEDRLGSTISQDTFRVECPFQGG